jgi:hypothetical protein
MEGWSRSIKTIIARKMNRQLETPMGNDATKVLNKVVRIDAAEICGHWDEVVRGTVEETLNALLNTGAAEMRKAQCCERSPDRVDTRAGCYKRTPHTTAGGVGGNCRNCASRHLGPRSVNAIAVFRYSRSTRHRYVELLERYSLA